MQRFFYLSTNTKVVASRRREATKRKEIREVGGKREGTDRKKEMGVPPPETNGYTALHGAKTVHVNTVYL